MKRKTKENIITYSIVAFFVLLGALLLMGGGDQQAVAEYSASSLSAQEVSFDFGTIKMKDGDVSHRYTVRNDGEEAVVIQKVYTSCMCTKAVLYDASGQKYGSYGMPGHGLSLSADMEIAPGDTAIVEAVFDPAAHGPSGVGLAQRSIYIETNSAMSPKTELTFQAMVEN